MHNETILELVVSIINSVRPRIKLYHNKYGSVLDIYNEVVRYLERSTYDHECLHRLLSKFDEHGIQYRAIPSMCTNLISLPNNAEIYDVKTFSEMCDKLKFNNRTRVIFPIYSPP